MPRKNSSQGFAHLSLIIVVAVVIAAIAFGAWYIWQNNKDDNKQTNSSAQTQQAESEPEIKQEQQETAIPEGWKFYKNDEAGFSFYYPPEWGEVEETSKETERVGGGIYFKFTALDKANFSVHTRDRQVPSLEFGNIKPGVVDVYLQDDGMPVVQLVPGAKAFRDFSTDQIVSELNGNKICIAEDYNIYDYIGEDPFIDDVASVEDYTYFAYCGLVNGTYGAFTFSSGQLDDEKPETRRLREDTNKLLQTFEIF